MTYDDYPSPIEEVHLITKTLWRTNKKRQELLLSGQSLLLWNNTIANHSAVPVFWINFVIGTFAQQLLLKLSSHKQISGQLGNIHTLYRDVITLKLIQRQGCQVLLGFHGYFTMKSRPFSNLSRPQNFSLRPFLRPL
jgi:hypothetical protein